MALFDWSEFTKRNNGNISPTSPIKIETRNLENNSELIIYELAYNGNVDIIENDELLLSFPNIDYVQHLYEADKTPVHRFFFEENGNDRFYLQCTDEKLNELKIRIW